MANMYDLFEERLNQVVSLVKETNKLPVLIIQQHPIDDGRELLFPPVRESISNIICFAEVCEPQSIALILDKASEVIDAVIMDIDDKRTNSCQIIEEVNNRIGSKPIMFYSDYGMWSSAAIAFILSIAKTIKNKKVFLLGNNYLTARLLQALLNYGAQVYVTKGDYKDGVYFLDSNSSVFVQSKRLHVTEINEGYYDIIIGGSILKPDENSISSCTSKLIFDVGLRNFTPEFINEQMNKGATIYRFDNRAGISSVVLNLMETDYLTTKNMGSVNIGDMKIISGGILGEEDSIVVDNAYAPEFIFGVADGSGMFKTELSEKNKEDLRVVKSLIEK